MEVTGNDKGSSTILLVGLTESEYENIWLRLKDRLCKQAWKVAGVAGTLLIAIGIGGVTGAYFWMKEAVGTQVGRYVSGPRFQDQVTSALASALAVKTADLRTERLAAEKSVAEFKARANALQASGIGIDENSVSLTAPDGSLLRIERGVLSAASKVQFAKPFAKPPLVIIADAQLLPQSGPERAREMRMGPKVRPLNAVLTKGTTLGFEIQPMLGGTLDGATWIAIGW